MIGTTKTSFPLLKKKTNKQQQKNKIPLIFNICSLYPALGKTCWELEIHFQIFSYQDNFIKLLQLNE